MKLMMRLFATMLVSVACLSQTTPPTSSHGYLPVSGGGQLYYEECGTGPAVILLHDGLLHAVVWDDVWEPLCAKYRVLRYDRRGYGRSKAATAPFSPVEDLLELMRNAHLDRATLVGSSSGTALALDFAIAHAERVEALFLIGPVVHGMRSSDYFVLRGNAASAPLAQNDIRAAAENWSRDRFQISGERPDARKKVFDTLVANPQNFSVPGQWEERPSPPTVTRLSEIKAPTLVIVGENDIADVHAFAGAIQAELPVVRREVWKDDGHLIQLEKPDELAKRIDAFITLAQRKTISLSERQLKQYTGDYAVGNSRATVAVKRGGLVLQLNRDADIPLFAESDSRFLIRTTGTEILFERDARGRSSAMLIQNAGGTPVRCPRL